MCINSLKCKFVYLSLFVFRLVCLLIQYVCVFVVCVCVCVTEVRELVHPTWGQ